MDVRQTWTDHDEAGDYVVPNVLSQRDLVSLPDRMDETVPHIQRLQFYIVLVKKISVIMGRSHRFLAIYQYAGGLKCLILYSKTWVHKVIY